MSSERYKQQYNKTTTCYDVVDLHNDSVVVASFSLRRDAIAKAAELNTQG